MDLQTDFHHSNMESLGLYQRAGSHGSVDEMNDYFASFVAPEIAHRHPELRYKDYYGPSISETVQRLMKVNY